MKRFLLAALLIFTLSGYADAAILVMSTNGTYTTKTTLEVARTAGDVAGKTVVVTTPLTEVQSNITAAWPADRALKVEKGGSIGNTTAFGFADGSSFFAGNYQVFAGSGIVTKLKEARPDWWTTNAIPGTTDMTNAISLAIKATQGVVQFEPAVYLVTGNTSRITDGIELKSNLTLQGVSGATEIRSALTVANTFRTPQGVTYTSIADVPHNITIKGIKFTKPNAVWSDYLENTGLLDISGVSGLTITECEFVGWAGDAIMLGFLTNATASIFLETFVERVEIYNNLFDGVTKDNRQAISIWDGLDVNIHHNTFVRTTRTIAPSMPGAIDVEPVELFHKIGNISIDNNTFDDIGGAVGAVSLSIGASMTMRAEDFYIRDNKFLNITNSSDIYVLGKNSTSGADIALDSPRNIIISGNTHNYNNRSYYVGGVQDLTISNNSIAGGASPLLLGYDDASTSHYPINGLYFNNNTFGEYVVDSGADVGIIVITAPLFVAEINNNTFVDCGNSVASVPTNMVIIQVYNQGLNSKYLSISNNDFINRAIFSISSVPLYIAAVSTMAYPTDVKIFNNRYTGTFNHLAFNSATSLYKTSASDYYLDFITQSSTNTPYVAGASKIIGVTGDTFTNFSGGVSGQSLFIIGESSGCIVQHNANVVLKSGTNVTLSAGKNISLINRSGVWYEI